MIVFVPVGLLHALAITVEDGAIEFGSFVEILGTVVALIVLAITGLLGEVFYTGAVAALMTGDHDDHEPPSLAEIAREIEYGAADRDRRDLRASSSRSGSSSSSFPASSPSSSSPSPPPIVEIEGQASAPPSAAASGLVRGRFWTVLAVLLPIELIGDSLTRLLTNIPHDLLGDSFLADWVADVLSNLATTPFYAVAAVLLTVELIREKEGTGPRIHSAPGPMTTASILADFWNDQIVAEEKQGLFLVLVGFLLSFAFIRMSTRLMRSPRVPWWPGSVVSESGVHLHHLVFGIVTMMIAGAVGFTVLGDSP